MTNEVQRPTMRVKEVARILDLDQKTIRRYLERGVLEGFKIPSGPYRVYADSVDALMENGTSDD